MQYTICYWERPQRSAFEDYLNWVYSYQPSQLISHSFFDYRKTSIRSRVPDTRRVPVRLRGSRPLVRIEAGSRIHAGSRLEAGSINSFQYGQTPNTLLTLITTYATSIDMELDMSVDSIDAEPDEDEENEPLIWQWRRRRWWREQSGQWWLD